MSPWEAQRLGIPGAVVTPVHPGTARCAFHLDGACSVYERRPFICRLYGTSAVAPCEQARAPTTLIPTGRAIEMVRRFEAGCPPSWQADRRRAVREAILASGDADELAALDEHQARMRAAQTGIDALRPAGPDATATGTVEGAGGQRSDGDAQ